MVGPHTYTYYKDKKHCMDKAVDWTFS